MDLSGKVALITGGAQRVGRCISLALAEAGADIVINHFGTKQDAENTKNEIEKLGRRCLIVEADITNIEQVQNMIDATEEKFSKLDILIHNASNINQTSFLNVTEESWESSLNVNLKGPFFLSQAAVKLMLKNNSGRIISLIGDSYYENWPNFIPHSIAKTAHVKMIQSLAVALSPTIQCTAICPAGILPAEAEHVTQSITSNRGDDHQGQYTMSQGIKLHKGTPEDVAELVTYLSGCSNYMNGAVIPIDGGKNAI